MPKEIPPVWMLGVLTILGNSATAHPVQWCMTWDWTQINWAVELMKFCATALGVLLGAYGAFVFSRKGRREDIHFKANFKAFEELAQYLYSIQIQGMQVNVHAQKYSEFIALGEMSFKGTFQSEVNKLAEILFQFPRYRQFMLYTTQKNETYFNDIMGEYITLMYAAQKYGTDNGELINTAKDKIAIENLNKSFQVLNSNISLYIHSLYNEQKFPTKRKPELILPNRFYRMIFKKSDVLYPSAKPHIEGIPKIEQKIF